MQKLPANEIDSIDAARERLRQLGWLTQVPHELREELLRCCRLLPAFERGKYLLRFGDKPDGIYGIVSGSFSLQIAPNEQGPQTVHFYGPGAWVGELAFCLGAPRATSMIATANSSAVFLPKADLEAISRKEPTLWRWIALCLAHNTRIALCVVDDMTIRSPRRRLAATLLRLAGLRPDMGLQAEASEALHMTHTDLAMLTNLSRTAVGQNLGHFEADGFIECGYGVIKLLDPARLVAWLRSTG